MEDKTERSDDGPKSDENITNHMVSIHVDTCIFSILTLNHIILKIIHIV